MSDVQQNSDCNSNINDIADLLQEHTQTSVISLDMYTSKGPDRLLNHWVYTLSSLVLQNTGHP